MNIMAGMFRRVVVFRFHNFTRIEERPYLAYAVLIHLSSFSIEEGERKGFGNRTNFFRCSC